MSRMSTCHITNQCSDFGLDSCYINNLPNTTCRTSAFIDDKNLRASSFSDLQTGIDITHCFDAAVDAIPNTSKTVVFATSAPARNQIQCCGFRVVTCDKLLGCSLSFTRRRSRHLMDQRAQSYITVARRIAMCPLSIDAREMLLASISYGIELGSCQIKLEKLLYFV